LPIPGSPTYLTALLSSIQALHPTLPVDPVVLQSLLLILITRLPKPLSSSAEVTTQNAPLGSTQTGQASPHFPSTCANLILRTREEDVAVLLHIVSLTLTTVFGFPTHKHKVAPKTKPSRQHGDRSRPLPLDALSPDEFLRSIFFRRPVSAEAKRLSTELTPRSGPLPLKTPLHTHRRSASQTPRPSPLRLSRSIDTDDNMDHFLDNTSMASSRRPLLMVSSATPSSTLRSRRTAARAEPLSLGL
ncbi:hypothetical protein FOMPIDRAFT_1099815, partial [Fomitopsis schrenkii]